MGLTTCLSLKILYQVAFKHIIIAITESLLGIMHGIQMSLFECELVLFGTGVPSSPTEEEE